jgi:hypothetical protein
MQNGRVCLVPHSSREIGIYDPALEAFTFPLGLIKLKASEEPDEDDEEES